MTGRGRFFSLGLAAALAAAGGTAWAVTQDGDSRPPVSAPTTGILAQGTAPGGDRYELSRIEPAQFGKAPTEAFCTEISTSAAMTQGCHPVPDEDARVQGQPLKPSLALLGSVRFFTLIAPKGVTAMEVRVEGEAVTAASRSFDAGSAGTLLVVIVGGPTLTSRDPASSRKYEVRLLDANGETVEVIAMSDPSLDDA